MKNPGYEKLWPTVIDNLTPYIMNSAGLKNMVNFLGILLKNIPCRKRWLRDEGYGFDQIGAGNGAVLSATMKK